MTLLGSFQGYIDLPRNHFNLDQLWKSRDPSQFVWRVKFAPLSPDIGATLARHTVASVLPQHASVQ